MIPSCKNCMYCEVKKNDEYVEPSTGRIVYGIGLRSYLCNRDMLFKDPDNLCTKWQHKSKLIRKIWRFYNE